MQLFVDTATAQPSRWQAASTGGYKIKCEQGPRFQDVSQLTIPISTDHSYCACLKVVSSCSSSTVDTVRQACSRILSSGWDIQYISNPTTSGCVRFVLQYFFSFSSLSLLFLFLADGVGHLPIQLSCHPAHCLILRPNDL